MAEIIKFDPTRKKPKSICSEKAVACDHKYIIAYTVYRTVCCARCGTQLDPFDVLVDMLKGYVPPGNDDLEEKRLDKEVKRRSGEKCKEDKHPEE